MRRTIVALALLLGSGCASLPACPERGGPPWTQVTSPHFTLRSDMPRAKAEQLVIVLEETRAAMVAFGWPGEEAPPGQLSVIALNSHNALSPFFDRNIVGAWTHQSPFPSTIVLGRPFEDDGVRFIAHGLAYSLIHWFSPQAPRWYREGLASYLESVRYDRKRREASVAADTLVRHHDLLRLSPLKTREIISTEVAPTGVALSRFQSSSWLLVQFLLDMRPSDFREVQRRLKHLENPRTIWKAVFGDQPMKEWDDQLYRYGGKGQFAAHIIPLDPIRPQINSVPMSDAQVHGARAFLFGVASDRDRASTARRTQEEVAEALRQPAGSLEALAVKFYSLRDDDEPEAVAVARQAVSLFPEEWLALVMSADANGLTSVAGQAAVLKAATLAPDQPEVLARLAIIRAGQQQWAESVKLSSRALALGATHVELFRWHAVASALTGDCQAAARYAEVVIQQQKSRETATQLSTAWPQLRERCQTIKAASAQPTPPPASPATETSDEPDDRPAPEPTQP